MQPTILIINDNEDDVLLTKEALSKTGQDFKTKVAMKNKNHQRSSGSEELQRIYNKVVPF